jgi:predicted DNA-binding protein
MATTSKDLSVNIRFRTTRATKRRLARLAKHEGRTQSDVLRRLIDRECAALALTQAASDL